MKNTITVKTIFIPNTTRSLVQFTIENGRKKGRYQKRRC